MKFSILAISLLASFTAAELVQEKCLAKGQWCSQLKPGNPPCCGEFACEPHGRIGLCVPPGTWERMNAEEKEALNSKIQALSS